MSGVLRIAKDLALPLDAVTQTFGILGKRGGGKSYTAKVMAEEMLRAKAHIACIDPIGNWWGLRVAADGKSPGLPVTVLGGEYGDIPIEPTEKAGELVARLIIEERISVVVDLSLFRKGEQITFMIGWAEALYRLNREALHVFVDEADAFAPQRTVGNLAPRLLGAMEDLVRRGRARGLGVTMITQRSASINKDLLTQIEVLIAKRTIAPQDREAIKAWVEVHGTPERQKTMMESLPSLPKEAAWFWSPAWLDVFKLVHIRELRTMDSSATPEVGRRAIEPRRLAEVDLQKVRARMADTIERAKADDPRELRKRIAELEKAAGKSRGGAPTPADKEAISNAVNKGYDAGKAAREKAVERAVEQTARKLGAEFRRLISPMRKAMLRTVDVLLAAAKDLQAALPPAEIQFKAVIDEAADTPPAPPTAAPSAPLAPASTSALLGFSPPRRPPPPRRSGGEQRVLDAIAWLEDIGVKTPEQPAVAFLANFKYGTGGYNNAKGSLRTAGLVEYLAGDRIQLTDEGRKLANFTGEALDDKELHERVMARLTGGERRVLRVILDRYPEAVDAAECATESNFTPGTGGFNNARGRLRTLGLIEYTPAGLRARDLLFPGR